MKRLFVFIITFNFLFFFNTLCFASKLEDKKENVKILLEDSEKIVLTFNNSNLTYQEIDQGEIFDSFSLPTEGFTFDLDQPILPAVNRFVRVPPDVGLRLQVVSENPRNNTTGRSPVICKEGEPLIGKNKRSKDESELYPPVIAKMSDPIVIRGVRIVNITTYPVQYNSRTGEYIHNDNIEVELQFTNEDPVNPARISNRKNRSPGFSQLLDALVLNNPTDRDDPEFDNNPEYLGHYLVVAHENCVEYITEFIEWRRKSGWKVDILSVDNNTARQVERVMDLIEDKYNEYLEDGIDPFDNILLVGDRSNYSFAERGPQWVLESFRGATIFPAPLHADYLFGCLEGDDDFPDVAISRWCAGDEETLGLFVGRTLAYEANPYMEETDWFGKGAVFSNHWGNGPDIGTWHISIQSNVRWGVEVLKHLGFDDIRFHEDFEWRGRPDNVLGVFERDLHNEGVNLLLGRTRNHYWWRNYQGVEDNVIFPIRLLTSGHSEWPTWNMLRTGDADHLKGPVAATCGWGNPQTVGMTIIWLEMIKGMLLKDLSLGWMRLSVLLAPMQYIPDFYQGHTQHIKADFDVYGDPAIQYWKDVPRVLDFSFPELIPSDIRMIEVSVTNPVNDEGIIGAQVTLYAPGDMPDPDDEDYADYEEMFMITRQTNTDGIVRFIFDEDHSFENNEVVYVTVTGRDILPLFGEIVIDQPQRIIDLAAYSLAEIEGNENGEINPGEIFSLTLTARNIGAEEINNVSAMVLSRSPWVEIENPDIAFGDIRSGAESESEDRVQIIFSQSVPDGVSRSALRPELSIEFTNGDETWISGISLIPKSPNFIVSSVLEDIIIGVEVEDLNIEIENIGSSDGQPLSAEIISLSGAIDVIENFAVYPEIEAGSTGRIRGELLSVSGISIVSPGSQYEMLLLLSQENGFVDTAYFKLQVGETRENVPFGPDNYGYVCLDDTDEMWEIAPAYDWIEISANEDDRDFDGTRFEFEGRSPHDIGEAICIPLGFTSQLYGVEFDSITVATNGFISIGNQPLATNMQNWPMDRGIGGGSGMIAPFWDNLRMIDESGVFWYLDEEDNRMIIEWYEMRLRGDNNLLNFQVLLYDKEFWGTPTGDPNIQFNYKTVEMRSGIGDWAYTIPYASVGISSPDGNSGINYTFNNQYPVAAAPLQNRRSILFTTILMNFGTAFIHGHVRDASNDSLLSGAAVRTTFGQVGITDENGYYIIEDVFCELLFNLTTFKQGFNDSTLFDFEMGEGDTLEINFALFHPEFEPSIRILNSIIDQGSQSELSFRIENPGNGTLDWTFDPRLPDNADVDPWALRRQYPLADMFDDYRINGVVFFDSLFYISGSNDDSPVIYIMNKAGELIDTLSQPGEDNRGMRDLAYDGELIWGCIGQVIYGITPEGELARSFNGPYNPSRQLTWDTQRECLWVSSTTTNPVAIDRNGNMIDGLEINRNGLRIYGLAYYGDDQDDSQLYIIHREIESYSRTVHKANIESGEMTFVSYLDPEQQDAPTGAFITNTYDPYSWVLLSITDIGNRDIGDQLEIWQIEGRTDWYSLEVESDNGFEEAESGIILPEEFLNFNLSFNAEDLPINRYEIFLNFQHNAEGGIDTVHGILNVTGPVPPFPFVLLEPADLDTIETSDIAFKWAPSLDPNEGEDVHYELWINLNEDSTSFLSVDTTFALALDTLFNEADFSQPFRWWVNAYSGEDTTECENRFSFRFIENFTEMDDPLQPFVFGLSSIFPNPFNNSATINFEIDKMSNTMISIYDISGREVILLKDEIIAAGQHTVLWNGEVFPSGVYFVQLESLGRTLNKKVLLLK